MRDVVPGGILIIKFLVFLKLVFLLQRHLHFKIVIRFWEICGAMLEFLDCYFADRLQGCRSRGSWFGKLLL